MKNNIKKIKKLIKDIFGKNYSIYLKTDSTDCVNGNLMVIWFNYHTIKSSYNLVSDFQKLLDKNDIDYTYNQIGGIITIK